MDCYVEPPQEKYPGSFKVFTSGCGYTHPWRKRKYVLREIRVEKSSKQPAKEIVSLIFECDGIVYECCPKRLKSKDGTPMVLRNGRRTPAPAALKAFADPMTMYKVGV